MVCLNRGDNLSAMSSMAVAPERTGTAAVAPPTSKALHNFHLPYLKWGGQRQLRCVNVSDSGGSGASRRRSENFRCEAPPIGARREQPWRGSRIRGGEGEEEEEEKEGIAAVRRKILGDLKMAAAEIQDAFIRDGAAVEEAEEDEEPEEKDGEWEVVAGGGEGCVAAGVSAAATAAVAAAAEEEVEVRPWNLRTRRAACKAPQDQKVTSSSSSPEKSKTAKRAKFSLSLSKEEIEADYQMMLGQKPPRRPKKRSRHVQRQLEFQFPGSLLGEISVDSYKVVENPETRKR